MRVQIVKYSRDLIDTCGLWLWSIHNAKKDKNGRVYVLKDGGEILVLEDEYRILSKE